MKRAREGVTIPKEIVMSLAKMQDGLNKFIDKNWRENRSPDDWGLAVTIEATELMDSYPWKWWKNVKANPDFKNIKIELVDILHFSLSGTMQMSGSGAPAVPADYLKEIVAPLSDTQNAVKTFRGVIDLTRFYAFDTITSIVIAAADDLEFNLVAYYIAKHTLNYIRQLGGYKDGSYVKVKSGLEDNELLHACIQEISVEAAINEKDYEKIWDGIMDSVYTAFQVKNDERRSCASWVKC